MCGSRTNARLDITCSRRKQGLTAMPVEDKPRILIVEDEEPIRLGLTDVFVFHGFDVESAKNGDEGLEKGLSARFDLILLDVMLPGVDGFEICQRIRRHDPDQPIIMLTAKTADEDIVHGLALGADDYVSKPFSVAQLVLRVRAVLRRSGFEARQQARIRLGKNVDVDVSNLVAHIGDRDVTFTRREMSVLQYLYAHHERPVSREELLCKVWGYARDLALETRTVDIHIAKLRRKLEPEPQLPQFILTVRGAGYRLMPAE